MKVIDAKKAPLSVPLVRDAVLALKKVNKRHLIVRLHVAQQAAWENLGVTISRPNFVVRWWWRQRWLSWLLAGRVTMGGTPIIADLWMPNDRIRWELRGEAILAIVNLAVPPGYED